MPFTSTAMTSARSALLTATVAFGLLSVASPPVSAAPRPSGPYLIATAAEQIDGVVMGVAEFVDSAEGVLCRFADDELHECVRTAEFGEVAAGTIVWIVPSGAEYDAIIAMLTNGRPDQLTSGLSFGGEGDKGGGVWSETAFFAGTARPSGVDLQGYEITRIGLRVDAIAFETPGSDPNGNGMWTDLNLTARWVFEGTIAAAACKRGGWRTLHAPGGKAFRNQGDCVALASRSR